MAQNDMNIANQGFPAFRADLNDQLEALVTNSSGATAPATTFPHQWWLDTSTTPSTLRQRNAANDAWIVVGLLNQSTNTFNVPVAQGGTGLETLTANNVLLGNGTSAVQAVAPGTSGNVLTSNGTTWISDALSASILPEGSILQIVRATDTTNRSTTSTTFVDAGISVAITPIKANSIILVMWLGLTQASWTAGTVGRAESRITDNSNNPLSGAERVSHGVSSATSGVFGSGDRSANSAYTLIGRSTPNTTSPVTYKGQFRGNSFDTDVTHTILNSQHTGQLYAIEVAA